MSVIFMGNGYLKQITLCRRFRQTNFQSRIISSQRRTRMKHKLVGRSCQQSFDHFVEANEMVRVRGVNHLAAIRNMVGGEPQAHSQILVKPN
jgi:hypothetical protein